VYGPPDDARGRLWYERLKIPVTSQGIVPGVRYVIRKKGVVELGSGSCAMCHSRVLPDGRLIAGAQGNFPVEATYAFSLRAQPTPPVRHLELGLQMPPLRERYTDGIYERTNAEIAEIHESMIPGLAMRPGFSYLDPPKIADLIGLKDRRYLDMGGTVEASFHCGHHALWIDVRRDELLLCFVGKTC
jgi:hypothetical protein